MAIFEERVLEPFVAKGLGNSGIASREIQVSNLPDLQRNIAQSTATRSNLQKEQIAKLASMRTTGGSGGGSGAVRGGGSSLKPIVLGRVGGSSGTSGWGAPTYVSLAYPDGKGGFKLRQELVNTMDEVGNQARQKTFQQRGIGLPINMRTLDNLNLGGAPFATGGSGIDISRMDLASSLGQMGATNALKRLSQGRG